LVRILGNRDLRKRMGQASLNVINRWSYEEDVQALKRALDTYTPRHFNTQTTSIREIE
jgi:hypothetical protein